MFFTNCEIVYDFLDKKKISAESILFLIVYFRVLYLNDSIYIFIKIKF